MCSPLSHGHYHIHLARLCSPSLLSILSIRWPLGLPSSHAGHLCLHLFVSERLFWLRRRVEGWKQGTLELPQTRPLQTTFELRLTRRTVPDLCGFRLLYALACTFAFRVHQRLVPIWGKEFRKRFQLELLSYRGCCKSPTVAIESHGGALGTEGSRLLQPLNNT